MKQRGRKSFRAFYHEARHHLGCRMWAAQLVALHWHQRPRRQHAHIRKLQQHAPEALQPVACDALCSEHTLVPPGDQVLTSPCVWQQGWQEDGMQGVCSDGRQVEGSGGSTRSQAISKLAPSLHSTGTVDVLEGCSAVRPLD